MKTLVTILLLCVGNMSMLFANQGPLSGVEMENPTTNLRLNMKIIGTENIPAKVFSYDIVGLNADASADYLTNGVTKDITTLIADLELRKNYVKIGIKLKWGSESKYFLFDRKELARGQIDMNKGKE